MKIAIINDAGRTEGEVDLGPEAEIIPHFRATFGPTGGTDADVVESFLGWLSQQIVESAASTIRVKAGREAKKNAEDAVVLPAEWGDIITVSEPEILE